MISETHTHTQEEFYPRYTEQWYRVEGEKEDSHTTVLRSVQGALMQERGKTDILRF